MKEESEIQVGHRVMEVGSGWSSALSYWKALTWLVPYHQGWLVSFSFSWPACLSLGLFSHLFLDIAHFVSLGFLGLCLGVTFLVHLVLCLSLCLRLIPFFSVLSLSVSRLSSWPSPWPHCQSLFPLTLFLSLPFSS